MVVEWRGRPDNLTRAFYGVPAREWTSVRFADGLITDCSAASATGAGHDNGLIERLHGG
jgi:hypothetical protein